MVPRQSLGVVPVGLSNYGVPALQALTFEYLLVPVVTGVQPRGGLVGEVVTITGSYFGSSAVDFSVRLGDTVCSVLSFSNTTSEVVVVVPQLQPQVYNFVVKTLSIFESRAVTASTFSVAQAPSILGVTPSGGTNGTRITLSGAEFGSDKSQISIAVGSQPCTNPEFVGLDGTLVACIVSSQEAGPKNITLTRFGHLVARSPVLLQLEPAPGLASVSPRGGVNGTVITVYGVDFGDGADLTVDLVSGNGDTRACELVALSLRAEPQVGPAGASVQCVVPPDLGADAGGASNIQGVRACRFGRTLCNPPSDTVAFIVAAAPELTELQPPLAVVGQTLTIRLLGGGSVVEDLAVRIGEADCPIVGLNTAGTEIECNVSAPVVEGLAEYPVVVQRFNLMSNALPFSYILTPVVTSVVPPGGRRDTVVTVSGEHFGSGSNVEVLLGGLQCVIQTANDTVIVCTVQGQFLGSQSVVVRHYESESAPSSFAFIDTPRVSDVSPTGGYGGELVTVVGKNFGLDVLGANKASSGVTVAEVAGAVEITVGRHVCEIEAAEFDSVSLVSTLVCRTPTQVTAADFGEQSVLVSVYGIGSNPGPVYFFLVDSMIYFVQFSSAEGSAIAVLTVLSMVLVAVMSALFVYFREAPVVRAASPLFCQLVLLGLFVNLMRIFMLYNKPTESLCLARIWMSFLGYIIFLSNLFVKSWRIWRIFDNKSAKRVVITNSTLLMFFALFLAVDVVLLGIWSIADPPQPNILFGDPSSWTCASSSATGSIFSLALYGYIYLLLVFGAFLAFSIRNVKVSSLNESRHIAFSIYNVLVILTLVLIVGSSLRDQKSVFIVTALGDLLITWGILGTLFVPKLYLMWNPPAALDDDTASGSTATTATGEAVSNRQSVMMMTSNKAWQSWTESPAQTPQLHFSQ
eukprot:TRINITY_DN1761_c0_g3_i1.p1 TRINITY_DN1761_c0_g3~~TRINITY_DN1761_c0_g3_i1.p1  ORF type:complete len:1039 (-),score=298.59 TRINITY_DN1761_c0_g3_i1:161-2905(-)